MRCQLDGCVSGTRDFACRIPPAARFDRCHLTGVATSNRLANGTRPSKSARTNYLALRLGISHMSRGVCSLAGPDNDKSIGFAPSLCARINKYSEPVCVLVCAHRDGTSKRCAGLCHQLLLSSFKFFWQHQRNGCNIYSSVQITPTTTMTMVISRARHTLRSARPS